MNMQLSRQVTFSKGLLYHFLTTYGNCGFHPTEKAEINACELLGHLFLGMIRIAALIAIGVVALHGLPISIAWVVAVLNAGYVEPDITLIIWWSLTAVILFIFYGSQLFSSMGEKMRMWRKQKYGDQQGQPSLLSELYSSFKDKTCFRIEFK